MEFVPGRRWRRGCCAATSSRLRGSGCRRSSARRWRGSTRSTRPTSRGCRTGGDPALVRLRALGGASSTRSASRCPAVEAGLRWLRANPPAPAEPRARPRRLPARQPDRRRGRAGGGDRLGALPRSATRPRTSAGSASAPGASATTSCRWPGSASWSSCSTPTRPRAGRRPERRAAALVGGDGKRQVGGDLRPPGPRPPDRRCGRSHELASLGRRICEPEWDMLRAGRDADLMQDRPDRAELLEAVAE